MTRPLSKCAQLRQLLESPRLEFIMEAHNGISARIVEEAGFRGIWGSGLALSAQFGVRDNNEASWTQVVEMLEFMSDVTRIPILLDGDTGYGNFNNMRRLVMKLEQRDIAGVCIEDKLFPKTNSFINSEQQPLADIDEFCGKIKAGKDSQSDPDFRVVARVEALIAGWDLREALRRAEAYRAAGADAILIHSKLSRPDEILAFAKEWAGRAPLVIVPTKYYSTPTEVFRQAGISLVIWANHLIRAAAEHMQVIARAIHDSETSVNIEDQIAPVNEIFRLQGADELQEAERRYFFSRQPRTQAVVLAATRGSELNGLTQARPKAMLPIGGKSLLRRLAEEFKKQGVNDITVVGGYRADSIDEKGINLVLNPDYEHTGELASLACALPHFSDDMVVLYGDLLFRGYILRDLLDREDDITVVVDSSGGAPVSGTPDYAFCSRPDDHSLLGPDVNLLRVGNQPKTTLGEAHGRWIGMLRLRGQGRQWLTQALQELQSQEDFNRKGVPDLLNHLIAQGRPVRVLYIYGHWLDVNSLEDLERAGHFAQGRST
jgi:phosphoenolpyruvate phosphomutase